jgi:hypothetical protein
MAEPARTVVSLNGTWDLAFDPENVGKPRRWFARFPRSVKMQVPGVWELIRPGYDGVGWYRRSFDAPPTWMEKTVRVRFMAASYYAECWLNGQFLGAHEGGYTPFDFDLSPVLRPGANELIVRVINPPVNYPLEGFRAGAPLNQSDIPIGKGAWYFNFGGLWQDVFLLVTDPVYVEDCFARPFPPAKKAVLDITIRNGRKAGRYVVTCRVAPADDPDRPVATRTLKVALKKGENTLSVAIPFLRVRLWSPDDPFLYVAAVQVAQEGRLVDEHSVRFGMREFTIKGGRYYLNDRRIKLKGFLNQGMYPRTLSYPETRESAVQELKLLKDNGFNFMRLHLKPAPWWYLDLMDEMGIMAEGEPPAGWNSKSPRLEPRIRNEVIGLLKRDRNHPSIIFWCLLNEAYHYRGYTMEEIKGITSRVGAVGRKLDPTRLMMDTSGSPPGTPAGDGTDLLLPNSTRTACMADLHAYCPIPVPDSSIESYRTMGKPGVAAYVSEYGAPLVSPDFEEVLGRYSPSERRRGLEDYVLHRDFYESLKAQFQKAGLAGTFGTVRHMLAKANGVRADEMRHITAAMRLNPRLGGFALCQLADASGELFGATDVWRRPKELFHQLASIMPTPLLVPLIRPRVFTSGTAVTVRAGLVNEDKLGATYDCHLEIARPRGRVLQTFSARVRASAEAQTAISTRIRPDLRPGKYELRAVLRRGRQVLTRQAMEFTVLPHPAVRVPLVAAWDQRQTIRQFLKGYRVQAEVFSNNYRNKNVPILMDMRTGGPGRVLRGEVIGELKKIVQLGGCAVLFNADVLPLYEFLFPTLIRVQGVMRTIGYVKKHPIFAGLPSDCVVGYEYARVCTNELDKGEDVLAAGGDVIVGGLSQHMWTRPAVYYWGVNLYTVPIGRGHVIVCNMNVLDPLDSDPVAQLLMANIVNYAASIIEPGREEKLLSRCIDPLSERDYS